MTVTVDQIKAVADDVEAEGYNGRVAANAIRMIADKREGLARVAADPNASLAADIRNAFYNDGVSRALVDSRNPASWLRMAAAAREFIAAEQVKPEQRPLRNGDRVKVTGPAVYANDFDSDYFTTGDVLIVGSSGRIEGSDTLVDEDGDVKARATEHAPSHYIAASSLTLIEDEPEPEPEPEAKPEPRVWQDAQDIPVGVRYVDRSDMRYVVTGDGILTDYDGEAREGVSQCGSSYAPYTEVLGAVVVEPEARVPRAFNVGDAEPEDRDTIKLRGISLGKSSPGTVRPAGAELTIEYGTEYGSGRSNYVGPKWWQTSEEHQTYREWDSWLEHYGPLVEILPEPEPRKFVSSAEVPEGVQFTPQSSDNGSWIRGEGEQFTFIFPGYGNTVGDPDTGNVDTTVWRSVAMVDDHGPFVEVLR